MKLRRGFVDLACQRGVHTFDVTIDASGLSSSQWLTGEVRIYSDAANVIDPYLVIPINVLVAEDVEDVKWDTAATSDAWGPKNPLAAGDNLAITASNHGSLGHSGLGGVNLDFSVDGSECDPDAIIYLHDASPFIIINDGSLALTTSHWTESYEESYGWKPQPWPEAMTSGNNGVYDSTYLGLMVNRDTTLGVERTIFAPRNNAGNPSFVVSKIQLYPVDGNPHSGVTFGDVADWDIPSANPGENASFLHFGADILLVMQGTGSSLCQDNSRRMATEVVLGWHTNAEFNADPQANNDFYWGAVAQPVSPLLEAEDLD